MRNSGCRFGTRGHRHAVLRFTECNPRNLDDKEKGFINGILHSLALVLNNIHAAEQQRLATIGQMASGIVHDLKNNITIIQGYAELAEDSTVDTETRTEYLQLISSEANQLADMAYEILDFSRGDLNLEKSAHDMQEYLDEVARSLQPMFDESGINFSCKSKLEGNIRIDGYRFRRVLSNIAANAHDALLANGGGTFVVEATRDDKGRPTLTLTDDGPGIPDEIRDSIFQPFVTHGKAHGTGLGMAVVKSIVDAHDGEIQFTSEAGKGTTFTIRLP